MKSKKQQAFQKQLSLGIDKIQSFVKKRYLNMIIKQLQDFPIKLYKYSGRQSQQKTQWFLKADLITPDLTKNILKEDTEAKAKSSGFNYSNMTVFSKRLNQRGSVKYASSSFSHSRRSIARNSLQKRESNARQVLMPLDNSEINSDSQISEESEIINNFRQQRSRRQQYKHKLMQAQRAEIFKLIDRSITGFILNPMKMSKKKEKVQQIDHFINIDVTVRQPENTPPEKLKKVPQKIAKSHHSKTERNGKDYLIPVHLPSDKYQELKQEEKIYLLNVPNQLKLSPGVTFRENQKHQHNHENIALCGTTRKKLQFLKNEEMNPIKIKMAELMSFKKIATSNNLAYCSSMKTVKDLPKDGIQSKISIDSKQFVEEPSGSKKLIKIANRKIYEQLLVDFNQEAPQLILKKGKFKSKKQVKVRFDNMTPT